jgi:chromosome segregation ATPase
VPDWLTYVQAGERFGMSADAVRMRAHRLGWRTQPGNDGRTLIFVPDDAAIEPRTRSPARSDEHSPAHGAEIVRLMTLLAAADARVEKAEQRAEQAEKRAELAENRTDSADIDRRAADARADRAVAATARADAAEGRADRAEQGREGECSRADALRDRLDVLQAQLAAAERASADVQAVRTGAEERAGRAENDVFELKAQLATAQIAAEQAGREAEAARQATHAFLDEDAARRRLGVLARLRAAWRGE